MCVINGWIKEYENHRKKQIRKKPSSFLAVCSNCGCDINSHDDVYSCPIVECLFRLCSKKSCHHYIDQNNYCANCKRTSKFVEDVDKVDCEERMYDDKFNEGCVTASLTVGDDDNDANVNTATNTMISIACTVL